MNDDLLPPQAKSSDRSHMDTVIERVPVHISIALASELPGVPRGPFSRVWLCAMGGSALPGEVLMDVFAGELQAPMSVWRYYGLPPDADEKALIIACSFSGATEETLSGIQSMPPTANNVVVIAGGGQLAEVATARNYPLIVIPTRDEPPDFQPRSAFGFIVTYLARVLHAAGVLQDPYPALTRLPGFLTSFLKAPSTRQRAGELASWLEDRIPIVCTDESHVMSVARIAKIKFNENAKRPAFFNAFPELNHNEMIGFTAPVARFGILYFHDPTSHPRIRERFDVMKRIFRRESIHNVAFEEWEMPGATRGERVFAAIIFADWCAYYTALLAGLDPTPVTLVEHFKKLLGPMPASSGSSNRGGRS